MALTGRPRLGRSLLAGAAALGASAALALVLAHVARWSPAQSFDTSAYYYPHFQAVLARIHSPTDFTTSLLTPAGAASPGADRAKPVFMAVIQAFSLAFDGGQRSFVAFEIASYVLASLAFLWLGARLGWLWPAFWAWALVFSNPWTVFVSFFDSYTALSLALLFLVFGSLLGPRPHPRWAGAASFLLVFTSQSATVLCAGLFAAVAVLGLRDRRRLGVLAQYAVGGGVAWGLAEGLVLVTSYTTGTHYSLFVEVLVRYLARSGAERAEYFAAYDASVLGLLVWLHARTACGLLAGSLWLAWRRRREAGSEAWFPLLLAVAIAGVLIDVRVGPKFPRTYLLLFPLAMLAAGGLYYEAARRKPALKPILGALLAVALLENALGLADLKSAALGVREVFDRHAAEGQTVYVEEKDTFDRIFRAAYFDDEAPAFEIANVCHALAGAAAVRFLSSPNLSSPFNLPGRYTDHAELALGHAAGSGERLRGVCNDFAWEARAVAAVPSLALYPILALEDPREAYRFVVEKRYGARAYREGIGTATLWDVRRLSSRFQERGSQPEPALRSHYGRGSPSSRGDVGPKYRCPVFSQVEMSGSPVPSVRVRPRQGSPSGSARSAHAASKGGVVNLTRELAAQWARRGVRVNALAPGWFPTEMTADMFGDEQSLAWMRSRTPLGRGGELEELVGPLLFLASDASSFVTGHVLAVDGGWTIV